MGVSMFSNYPYGGSSYASPFNGIVDYSYNNWVNPFMFYTICQAIRFKRKSNVTVAFQSNFVPTPGTFVVFKCKSSKLIMEGEAWSWCSYNGRWTSPIPVCRKRDKRLDDVTCPKPTLHEQRKWKPNGSDAVYIPGTQLTFYCEPSDKYELVGKENVVCLKTGEWNKAFPICKPEGRERIKLCPVPPKTANLIHDPVLAEYRAGLIISFECKPSQRKVLKGKQVLTCQRNGRWDNAFPTCVDRAANKCFISKGNDDMRFRVEGKTAEDKDWGTEHFTPGTQLSDFRCFGHTVLMNDVEVLTCKDNGKWDQYPIPVCGFYNKTHCDADFGDAYGRKNTLYWYFPTLEVTYSQKIQQMNWVASGTVANYKCQPSDQYRVQGASQATCLQGNVWKPHKPKCVPTANIKCDLIDLHEGVQFRAVNPRTQGQVRVGEDKRVIRGTVVHFSCRTGRTLVGPRLVICRNDGMFNATLPRCNKRGKQDPGEELKCHLPEIKYPVRVDKPYHIDRGIMQHFFEKNLQSPGATIKYSCKPATDFTIQGFVTAFCTEDGVWNVFRIPKCIAKAPPK